MNEIRISNQPVDEMKRLGLAAREVLTDSMIDRLAITSTNALEVGGSTRRRADPSRGSHLARSGN
jgi:hypothetical protein